MPASSPEPEQAYRPVSGPAVVGLALAALFALGLAVAAVLAWRSATPLLLPPIVLLVPLVASCLCVAGWLHVRRSEGTRVGRSLARAGLGLSLLCGLGYGAYRTATELALRQQANEFSEGWFALAASADETDYLAAFWSTLDPARRDSTLDLNTPEGRRQLADHPRLMQRLRDEATKTPRFDDHALVQLLRANPGLTVGARGVRRWQHYAGAEGGYVVEQNYRLTGPEGGFDVVLAVFAKDLDRRRWYVLLGESVLKRAGAA